MKQVFKIAAPLFVVFGLIFILPVFSYSQEVEYFECPELIPTFPSNEYNAAATCDYNAEHPNFNNEPVINIGTGTPFPTSSSLGISITDNVRIVADFTIDAPFAFENAVVAISQNVQIVV